jgi:hypothetical protein
MNDQGDNHIRMIKQALQQQFPRMDGVPVTKYVPYHRHCPGCGAPSDRADICGYCRLPSGA